MSLRKIPGLVCLALTIFCLFIGFSIARQWIALTATLIPALAWMCAYKWPAAWLAAAALFVSVGLAASGLIAGASPFLMLVGASLALATWSLGFLAQDQPSHPSLNGVTLLEKTHFQSLGLTLGLSLLIIGGRLIHFQIPFGGMILLVLAAFFCLRRVWRLLSK